VHAGWRGIVARVLARAVAALEQRGAQRRELLAAIGPCVGVQAYEVGEEVATEFGTAGLAAFVARTQQWPRPHLDCYAAVRQQLQHEGLPMGNIDGRELCTATALCAERREFFSYRRDGARSGRMGAVIVAG
jgi:YfiH family protein